MNSFFSQNFAIQSQSMNIRMIVYMLSSVLFFNFSFFEQNLISGLQRGRIRGPTVEPRPSPRPLPKCPFHAFLGLRHEGEKDELSYSVVVCLRAILCQLCIEAMHFNALPLCCGRSPRRPLVILHTQVPTTRKTILSSIYPRI